MIRKYQKAQVMAHGHLAGRFSLWMDSAYWRVTGYSTTGDTITVHLTQKDDMKKTFKKRHSVPPFQGQKWQNYINETADITKEWKGK